MAKMKIRYRTRRAKSRRHKSFTLIKGMKIAIAVAPVAADAVASYQANGGGSKGASAALGAVSADYTGYNAATGTFAVGNMVKGYVPLAGAWLFGKVASRVLRV